MDGGYCKQRKLLSVCLDVRELELQFVASDRLSVGQVKLVECRMDVVSRLRRGRPEWKAIVRRKDLTPRNGIEKFIM